MLNRLITQSGVLQRRLLVVSLVAAITAALVLNIVIGNLALKLLGAIAAGIVLPLLFLVVKRRRRLRQFENQLPDAVDVMVRSLRAGHPVSLAVALVGREMADPIGTEFGIASDEMTYGLDREAALVNLRERTGQGDLAFLVVAISIQSKTGGNLAEILSNLSTLIRARFKMRRKIHVLTSEGRFSAVGLSVVPARSF